MASLIAKTYNGKQVRTISCHNQVWFLAKDVCAILGYSNKRDALRKHVDKEDRRTLKWRACRILRHTNLWSKNDYSNKQFINESGVYALIFSSKLPTAKKFKRWVTHEVLPSIRKTGKYSRTNQMLNAPKSQLFLSLYKQSKHLERAQSKNKQLLTERRVFRSTKRNVPIGQVAKVICNSGHHIGRNTLFRWLRKRGYLIGRGRERNVPKQMFVNQGLFAVTEHTIRGPHNILATTVLVTPKGQQYFVKKFLKESKHEK